MSHLVKTLDDGGYSCVIANGDDIRTFRLRGIADLYRLRREDPDFLRGAIIADKIVGKGAAALMASGGVKRLFTHVISDGALALLLSEGVEVEFGERTPHIINREGSGWCPVEQRCREVDQVAEILPILDAFVAEMAKVAEMVNKK